MLKEAVASALGRPNVAKHGYATGVATFLPVDVDAVRAQLGIAESAVLRGQQNLPKQDAEQLDEIERAIVKRIESVRREAAGTYDAEMKAYGMRLSVDFDARIASTTGAARIAEGDMEATIQHTLLELSDLRGERNRAERDLLAFREQNRLQREARVPSMPSWLTLPLLALVLACETALNGTFFAERVEGGLVQGFAEALIFALINVVCGFIAGQFGATNLLHVRPARRLGGGFLLTGLTIVLVVNNALIAHYRSALGSGIELEQATLVALANMKESFFGFTDLKSWVLFGVGLLAAGIAGLKGFFLDDPYPGYGAKQWTYKRAVNEFLDAKQERMYEITAARDRAIDAMAASLRSLSGTVAQYRTATDARARLHKNFLAYLGELEAAANDLLLAYRQKNSEVRTEPAPAYFRQSYTLPRLAIEAPASLEDEAAGLADLVREACEQLQAQQAKLHDVHDDALARLNSIN